MRNVTLSENPTGGMRGTVDIRLLSIAAMVLRSASGQTRRSERLLGMSALPPIATNLLHYGNCRYGPQPEARIAPFDIDHVSRAPSVSVEAARNALSARR